MSFADPTGRDASNAPSPTGRRTVTAFFDSRSAVQKAIDDLVAAGVAKAAISLVEGGSEPVETTVQPSNEKGFWARLTDLFMPEQDRQSYGEGLRRGGFLLAVRCEPAWHDSVVGILDRDGAVDMNERETAWKLEGWTPAAAAPDHVAGLDDAAWVGETKPTAPAAATDLGASVPADELLDAYRGSPEIPLPAEPDGIPPDEAAPGRIRSRDPNAGRARVRSFLDEG